MRPDDVVIEAVTQTGLDDFGSHTFRPGLEAFCAAASGEAQLNDFGAVAVRTNVVSALANRLKIIDYARRHPEVASEAIDRPLVVIGMFRAGTTLLSRLLDEDPCNRALLSWETADPVPPPTPGNFRVGPRVEAVRASQELLAQVNPKLSAVHREEADRATECLPLLAHDFKSLLWEAVANVPSYGGWLREVDQRSAYEHHRLALQVLQHGGVRGRWTLKSPQHAIALDALVHAYPDAQLVLMHRDPVKLCGSVCSLIATLSGTFTDADFRSYIAQHWTSTLQLAIERIEAFRAASPDVPIVDVQYVDLVRDPLRTVATIYRAIGDELSEHAAAAIAAYVAANPKGKHGTHEYDLADFALDRNEIRERFAGYITRYDVALEE
jgi:hypothetical protein